MSNPNQANINTYLIGTLSTNLTATLSTIFSNPPNSNGILKINSILLNNFSPTLNSNITLCLNKYNASNVNLHNKLAVPANSRNYFLNRNAYLVLNEGDSLSANTDANNQNVSVIIGYEEATEQPFSSYQIGPAFAIEYLVVAGGAGSLGNWGGGGGGGGFRTGNLSLVTANVGANISIIVGGGGAVGVNGSNSVFSSVCSTGGGIGGQNTGVSSGSAGSPGGSGGGGGSFSSSGGSGNTPPTTPSQGNSGAPGGSGAAGGGGGGAGSSGTSGSGDGGGPGGSGSNSNITGNTVTYAGGGGAGARLPSPGGGTGGAGGGGPGGAAPPGPAAQAGTPGTVNTGGGAGGGSTDGGPGACGGSGIVIVRRPLIRGLAATTGNVTITANVGYMIYQFNGSGSITF